MSPESGFFGIQERWHGPAASRKKKSIAVSFHGFEDERELDRWVARAVGLHWKNSFDVTTKRRACSKEDVARLLAEHGFRRGAVVWPRRLADGKPKARAEDEEL